MKREIVIVYQIARWHSGPKQSTTHAHNMPGRDQLATPCGSANISQLLYQPSILVHPTDCSVGELNHEGLLLLQVLMICNYSNPPPLLSTHTLLVVLACTAQTYQLGWALSIRQQGMGAQVERITSNTRGNIQENTKICSNLPEFCVNLCPLPTQLL